MVALLLATAALWARVQTSLKNYKMGYISKGVANTMQPAIKKTKNMCYVTQVLQLCVKLLQRNTWLKTA